MCRVLRVGRMAPSRCWKNSGSPSRQIREIRSRHLATVTLLFLGKMSSRYSWSWQEFEIQTSRRRSRSLLTEKQNAAAQEQYSLIHMFSKKGFFLMQGFFKICFSFLLPSPNRGVLAPKSCLDREKWYEKDIFFVF